MAHLLVPRIPLIPEVLERRAVIRTFLLVLCLPLISTFLFSSLALSQLKLQGIDCTLNPGERASSFHKPVLPIHGEKWEITNGFGNVVTSKDVPGLPSGYWQHTGIDYLLGGSSSASQQQTVYAAGAGRVVFSTNSNPNPNNRRGGLVIIRHMAPKGELYQVPAYTKSFMAGRDIFTISNPAFESQEILTYYLHLDPEQVFVSQGDDVSIGQPIAKLYSIKDVPKKFIYPPHLHFEVWERCSTIERNGYDLADTQFQEAVTDLLIDPASSLIAHLGIMDDDFNDNFLDPNRWSIEGPPGTVSERNQRLEIALGQGAGGTGIVSVCSLAGNFDVQVDYTLLNWPPSNPYGLRLGAVDLGVGQFGEVGIYRNSSAGHPLEFYTLVFADHATQTVTTDTTGTLRLVRIGSTLSGYFDNGANWVLVGSSTATTTATRFNLDVSTSDSQASGNILIAFDNFKVNAGTITCP